MDTMPEGGPRSRGISPGACSSTDMQPLFARDPAVPRHRTCSPDFSGFASDNLRIGGRRGIFPQYHTRRIVSAMKQSPRLPTRPLGHTGMTVSVLGMGGFHQVEARQDTIDRVVACYLQAGGTYIETARGYGGGASEMKLGRSLARYPRDSFYLASKTGARDAETAWRELNESLEALQTSYLDVWFFHGVNHVAAIHDIAADTGALKAFERARDEGMVRHIGLSSHWPMTYIEAARRLPLDVVLIWGNYLDFCNYPEIPHVVLPTLRSHRIGITFMKPLADGFLHRSPELALRYALAQDADCIVAGFNSLDMLETDLAICSAFESLDEVGVEAILREAPELGRHVCRQCVTCSVFPEEAGTWLKRIFELEGKFDRQMDDRQPCSAAEYALRERLKGWFGNGKWARDTYANEAPSAPKLADLPAGPCTYGLDIPARIALADAKLRGQDHLV